MIVLIPSVDLFLILCREAWDGVSSSWWVFLGEERDVDHHIGKNPKNKNHIFNGLWRILVGIMNLGFATGSGLGIFLNAIYLLAL